MVNGWLTRDSLFGAWADCASVLGIPPSPSDESGPVLHLKHTRRGVWAGPPPPEFASAVRLEADFLIGQRESCR